MGSLQPLCGLFILYICLISAAIFNSACDRDNYGPSLSSRAVILPRSLPEGVGPRDSEILHWYIKGLGECNSFLNTMGNFTHASAGSQIRDNSYFYKLTGLLLWPFGPLQECPTHSECWFGILSCGNFLEKHFVEFYESRRVLKTTVKTPSPMPPMPPPFHMWSMKALHVHAHISGVEGVLPEMYHRVVDLSAVHDQVKTFKYPTSSVQIGLYTLTLPGQYSIDMWLQGFYMGKLFSFSQDELRQGLDEVLHVPFLASNTPCGGDSCQCRDAYFDCCDCITETFLVGAPFQGYATYRGHLCQSLNGSESLNESPAATTTSESEMHVLSLAQQAPLPRCTDGNHIGRWLSIPDSVLHRCRSMVPPPDPRLSPHQLEQRIFLDSQNIDTNSVWSPVLSGIKNSSLDMHTRLRYAELNRYILPTDNVCALQGGVRWLGNGSQAVTSSRYTSEVYAPYTCRYDIMSTKQAHSCLKTGGVATLGMHGDSLMRMLFGDVAKILQLSDKSQAELKTLSQRNAKKNQKNIIFTGAGLTLLMMTRYEPYHETLWLPVGKVDVLATNYAIAHNLLNNHNPEIFATKVNKSGIVKFIQKRDLLSKPDPIKKFIYLSANDLQAQYCFINQPGTSPNNVRIMNDLIRRRVVGASGRGDGGLDFYELDQFLLTAPKTTSQDSFHFYGPARQMLGYVFMHMVCSAS